MTFAEDFINNVVQWLRLGIETLGVVIIALGVVVSLRSVVKILLARGHNFNAVRLQLARYLALGLEFQLGSDILSTAIRPDWDEIGKLAAIAVIRTGLNYFLTREMEQERSVVDNSAATSSKTVENAAT